MIFKNKLLEKKIFKEFVHIMGVKPLHVLIPIFLSMGASLLEGVNLWLLIPLVTGVTKKDYSLILNKPVIGNFLKSLCHQTADFVTEQGMIFFMIAGLIFLISIFRYSLEYSSKVYSNYWNGVYSKRIGEFVFNRFLSFGNLYFDKIGQSYVTIVMGYTEKLLPLFNLVQTTIREFFYIIIILIIMLKISWELTLFAVVLFPILNFALSNIIKRIIKLSHRDSQTYLELNKNLFNMLSCLPLIKVYSKEQQVSKNFSDSLENRRRLTFTKDSIDGLTNPIQETIIRLAVLCMVAFVAFVISKNKSTDLTLFMIFFYLANYVFPKFTFLNTAKIALANLKPALLEIIKVLDNHEKEILPEGNQEFEGLKQGITIDHLNFTYIKNRDALKDISCFIEKGKVTAIVGSSGSGKTTLINLLMRLYHSTPGSIKIDGVNICDFKLNSFRTHMSIVTQNNFLFNDTIRNNIAFGVERDVSDAEIWNVLKRARLDDFVDHLPQKLDTQIGDRGVKISGGEQQRVSIARALIRNTEILMLDEATSFLDSKTEALIQQSIDEAIKGKTTIVIAHRLSTIKNADKIIVLEKGRIVEQGSLLELIREKGRFFEYWEAQRFF